MVVKPSSHVALRRKIGLNWVIRSANAHWETPPFSERCSSLLNDHGTLFHIKRIHKTEQKFEVVSVSRAKELVRLMHQHKAEGICVPGGINTLVRSFTANYYCKGIRKIVQSVLDHCCGTCKLSKTLKTVAPVPVANRTKEVDGRGTM